MAKTKITKKRKPTRYPIRGIETIRVATSLFMLGTALMLLSGRMTLIILRAFKLGTLGISEIKLMITTVKSRMFQGFLK